MDNYKLKISPLFKEDLKGVVGYIARDLGNPLAAKRISNVIRAAIRDRVKMPFAAEPYTPRGSSVTYYRIYVGNYIVFYCVEDDVMRVMRLIHGSRDYGRML